MTDRWNIVVGLGLVGGIGYLIAHHVAKSGVLELRGGAAGGAAVPGPVVVAPIAEPQRLSAPFLLVPGSRYVAAVDVSFPLSAATSAADVASEARKLGFVDGAASKVRPSRPPVSAGDYYITGTYSGPPRSFPRSNARGLVTVKDAWRIV